MTAILYLVWNNAHWSVAASITGIAINNEIEALMVRGLIQRVKKFDK